MLSPWDDSVVAVVRGEEQSLHKRVRLCMSCVVGRVNHGLSGRTVSLDVLVVKRNIVFFLRREGLNSQFKTTLQMVGGRSPAW